MDKPTTGKAPRQPGWLAGAELRDAEEVGPPLEIDPADVHAAFPEHDDPAPVPPAPRKPEAPRPAPRRAEAPPVKAAVPATNHRAEAIVLASAIDADSETLPPFVSKLISNSPEAFQNPQAAYVAQAVKALLAEAKPINCVSVGQALPPDHQSALLGVLAPGNSIPISLAEAEAESLWRDFSKRQARRLLLEGADHLEAGSATVETITRIVGDGLAGLTDSDSTGDEAIELGRIPEPRPDDGQELIRDRFLGRNGIMLLVGATGLGKSVLAMQLAVCWSVGSPCFGFRPTGPLRSLFCQSENDSGDLWEMRRGIYDGLQLSREQIALADKNVVIATMRDAVGDAFVARFDRLLGKWKPALGWIDPLLGFIGADASKQEVTSFFLRAGINRLLLKHNCAAVLVHHPPKPPKEQQDRKLTDWSYHGAGSSDIANLARSIVILEGDARPGFARLILGKRGKRLGWCEADGQTPRYEARIAHGRGGGLYWREADPEEAALAITGIGQTVEDLLALVPLDTPISKDGLISKAKDVRNIGRDRAKGFVAQLLDAGRLHEWRIHRPGTNPAKMLARKPQPQPTLNVQSEAA